MNNDLKDAINGAKKPEEPPVTSFTYGAGRFEIRDKVTKADEGIGITAPGIWYIGKDSAGEDKPPLFICSPLTVEAKTRDTTGKSWGRLLSWRDQDGVLQTWACPMELFSGDGAEVRAELLRGGLTISTIQAVRNLLSAYIQNFPTKKRARCVERLGWHGNRYVLPDETIGGGEGDETVVFQNPHALEPTFSVSGTVADWRENIATLAVGNHQLMFVLSAGFSGTILDIAGMEGGGFHLCGNSSKGKTTLLRAATSSWGNPAKHMRSWRSTANALEGAALLHNDNILILDEIKEISPKEAGAAVYMLANGQTKGRANRSGAARKVPTWRTLLLSSGEIGLAELMRQAGERIHAGQEIRLVEIPIDDFENLHEHATPGQFADALRENSSRYYGAVGIEFLRELVKSRTKQTPLLQKSIENFISTNVPAGASGQVSRVAKRFGLVAAAGELVTGFGLTGWSEGAAIEAAQVCFKSWLEGFGTGDREATAILSQVKAFFEAHSSSRFGKLSGSEEKIVNQVGFYSDAGAGKVFYVMPEAFKNELCKGLNVKTATKVLIDAGWLKPGNDKTAQVVKIPALGKTTRVYVFTGFMWDSGDDEESGGES